MTVIFTNGGSRHLPEKHSDLALHTFSSSTRAFIAIGKLDGAIDTVGLFVGILLGASLGALDKEGECDGIWESDGVSLGALDTLMPPPHRQHAVVTVLLSEYMFLNLSHMSIPIV